MDNEIFCLKCIKALQDLTDEEVREISGSVEEKEYAPNELIYVPVEAKGKVYFVREGEVNIYHKGPQGKKFIVDTLMRGDMFGDLSLVPRTPESIGNFARAKERSRVCVVDKVAFMDYLQRKPQVAYRIVEELSNRLAAVEAKVRDLALNNVAIRLLNELHRLSHKYGADKDNETVIKKHFTHEELAERVSATRETVTKVINDLEQKGFIRYDSDRNIVINRDRLATSL